MFFSSSATCRSDPDLWKALRFKQSAQLWSREESLIRNDSWTKRQKRKRLKWNQNWARTRCWHSGQKRFMFSSFQASKRSSLAFSNKGIFLFCFVLFLQVSKCHVQGWNIVSSVLFPIINVYELRKKKKKLQFLWDPLEAPAVRFGLFTAWYRKSL